jgi:hypothetical protein
MRIEAVDICDSCSILLGAERIRASDRDYCCTGCAAGGPCVCTYEHDLGRYPPSHYARPISMSEIFDRYDKSAGDAASDESK